MSNRRKVKSYRERDGASVDGRHKMLSDKFEAARARRQKQQKLAKTGRRNARKR